MSQRPVRGVGSELASNTSGERAVEIDQEPTWTDDPGPVSVLPASSALPALPAENRYERAGMLGIGGMAEVHLVRDRAIGRAVAMKVLDVTHGGSGQFRARFEREACVQGQLQHPSVVPVYDISKDAQGAEFFTMKNVTGVTLRRVLELSARGNPETVKRFPRRKLLTIFRQVCLCVEYAHSRGVIHRDLKPANVMLGDFGEVYVLDWGIAKLIGEAPGIGARDDRRADTLEGQILGTPGYMAPEQALSPETVDRRSDIYALGSILFEILTFERLYRGDDPLKLLRLSQGGHLERPSQRTPKRDIPPELDAICVKAIAADPSRRHSSARELVEDLDRFLEGDRNLQIRRELAEQHARAAEQAAARYRDSGDESFRNQALQEAGRALALDPASPAATGVLIHALLEPERELPPVARDAIMSEVAKEELFAVRLGLVAYGGFLLVACLLFWRDGVKSWPWIVAIITALVVAVGLCIYRATRPGDRPRPATGVGLAFFSSLAIGATSGIYGSFVVVPTLATANTLALNFGSLRRHRWFVMLCGCSAFAIPYVLQWARILPDPVVFTDGTISIHALAQGIHPTSQFSLLGISLAAIIGPTLAVWRLENLLEALRARMVVQLWHVQNVVGSSAVASIGEKSRAGLSAARGL